MGKIYLVTGGQRSGKSSYAQNVAMQLSDQPVYVATSRIWDMDFRQRVERHQQDRGGNWRTIEIEKELGALDLEGEVAVVDCVTLWLTNYFYDTGQDVGQSLSMAKEELSRLVQQDAVIIFVTNEIGMGTHASTGTGRKFADLQGWMNQHLAGLSDEVVLMVSGVPVKVKG